MLRFFLLGLLFFFSHNLGAQNFISELSSIAESEAKHHLLERRNMPSVIPESALNVKFIRLTMFLNPESDDFGGEVFYQVNKTGGQSFAFDAAQNLNIRNVWINGRPATFTHRDNSLLFNHEINTSGKNFDLRIEYTGVIPGGRSIYRTSPGDSIRAIWTLSQPYGASNWFPCFQNLTDKADSIEIVINCPQPYVAVANGVLVSDSIQPGDKHVYVYRHNYPIATYLMAVAVAPYTRQNKTLNLPLGSLQFVNYIWPGFENQATEQLKDFDQLMTIFENLLGPYPFRRELYGHAQFGWNGGMEHQTMSFMRNFNFGLVAHELAHQWFGNKVTCGSWQDLWLNEGFATYMTGVAYEHLGTGNNWLNWKQQQLAAITSEPDGTVFIADTTDVGRMFNQRLTYSKGAYLLHMLRYKMGDEPFFAALRDYLSDSTASYGFARTELLIYHLNRHGLQNAIGFFEDWFYGFGFPQYTIEWMQHEGKLYLVMDQKPSTPWANRFFDMDVPVWVLGNGLDTILKIKNNTPRQEIVFQTDKQVVDVVIDPDLWLISANNVIIKRDFTHRANHFKVVPNPVQNRLRIVFQESALQGLPIAIYNHTGGLVLNENREIGMSERSVEIDISGLQPGVYFVQTKDYYETHWLKFLKL